MRFEDPMKQAKTLTERDLKTVLAYCSTRRYAARDRAIVLVSHLAGLRAKEIAALTIGNVLADDGTIREEFTLTAEQTKGNKARRVFVCAKLRKEIALYMVSVYKQDPIASLFTTQKSKSFSANTLCQLLIEIYRNCGIVGATSHSGRRTFITNLAAKGVSVRVLAELAAHASISTTQRYIDVNDDQLRAAISML